MKKILALLLVAVMCLPLVACSNNDEEIKALNENIKVLEEKIENLEKDNSISADYVTEILGTWETSEAGGISYTFNADGTGTRNDKPIKWKYDSELSAYIICESSGQIVGITRIETDEDGARYFQHSIVKLYYKDN